MYTYIVANAYNACYNNKNEFTFKVICITITLGITLSFFRVDMSCAIPFIFFVRGYYARTYIHMYNYPESQSPFSNIY